VPKSTLFLDALSPGARMGYKILVGNNLYSILKCSIMAEQQNGSHITAFVCKALHGEREKTKKLI